jgi:hypothetical protein
MEIWILALIVYACLWPAAFWFYWRAVVMGTFAARRPHSSIIDGHNDRADGSCPLEDGNAQRNPSR